MAIKFISIVICMHNYVLCNNNNIMCEHELTLSIIQTLLSSHSQRLAAANIVIKLCTYSISHALDSVHYIF